MILRLSEHLTILIATAEDIMRRPTDMPASLPPAFVLLASELRRIDASPAEGERYTRAGIIMVNAIEGFFALGNSRWQMLIGATLPVLKDEAWKSRRDEKEAAAETYR